MTRQRQCDEVGPDIGEVPGVVHGAGHRAYVQLAAALGRLEQGEGGEGEQAQGTLGEEKVMTND